MQLHDRLIPPWALQDSTEQQLDRTFLRKWKWSHLLMDEAHAVKNAGASRTQRLLK